MKILDSTSSFLNNYSFSRELDIEDLKENLQVTSVMFTDIIARGVFNNEATANASATLIVKLSDFLLFCLSCMLEELFDFMYCPCLSILLSNLNHCITAISDAMIIV